MSESRFDLALEKRFTDSSEIATIDVTSGDTLLIWNSETGAVMRLPFSVLSSAISEAFSSSFASLVDGKVPAAQLPAYVDDVLEYSSTAAFPATGEAGKIYIALNTNKTYRWGGSVYVEISPSPGSTDSVTEGSVNLYFTNARASAAAPVQSVAGKSGAVTLTKADVGLSDAWQDANSPATLDANSSQKFKSGYLVQGGTGTTGSESLWVGAYYASSVDITFPTPFSSTNYRVTATTDRLTGWVSGVTSKTVNGCRIYVTGTVGGYTSGTKVDWIAVGY